MNPSTDKNLEDAPYGTPDVLFVLDTTAREPRPVRRHDVLLDKHSGAVRTYEFIANKYTEMPANHAMRFITNDAFVVKKDPGGPRMRPIPKSDDPGAKLQVDQVIANLDELTQDALLSRAKTKPGSEDFKKGTRKSVLIAFLMGVSEEAERQRGNDAEGDAGNEDAGGGLLVDEEDEMDEAALEDLLPKPNLPG